MRAIIQDVFRVLLTVVIPLAAFTTGLQARKPEPGETRLWRRPGQLLRDLLAVLLFVPLWVLALVVVLPVSPVVRGGLLIATLAVGIGPAASMNRMGRGTTDAREALDLNLIVLILSLAFVPIAFAAVAALFHRDLHVSVGAVAKVVLGRALVPLLLGLMAARRWPRFAAEAGPRLMKVIDIILIAVVVLALIVTGKRLIDVGGVGWLAAFLAALGSIAIGHALGGPDPATRGVVAAASVMRFPALALVLAAALPQRQELMPVILAYVLASFLLLTLYGLLMSRRRRKHETVAPIGASPQRA